MVVWIWVLIPLAGILMGAFSEWLKFKKETMQLSTSTNALESKVEGFAEELRARDRERDELLGRIQNLETIITSEAWDLLGQDRDLAAAQALPPLIDLEADDADRYRDTTDEAARLARRLRTRS